MSASILNLDSLEDIDFEDFEAGLTKEELAEVRRKREKSGEAKADEFLISKGFRTEVTNFRIKNRKSCGTMSIDQLDHDRFSVDDICTTPHRIKPSNEKQSRFWSNGKSAAEMEEMASLIQDPIAKEIMAYVSGKSYQQICPDMSKRFVEKLVKVTLDSIRDATSEEAREAILIALMGFLVGEQS